MYEQFLSLNGHYTLNLVLRPSDLLVLRGHLVCAVNSEEFHMVDKFKQKINK